MPQQKKALRSKENRKVPNFSLKKISKNALRYFRNIQRWHNRSPSQLLHWKKMPAFSIEMNLPTPKKKYSSTPKKFSLSVTRLDDVSLHDLYLHPPHWMADHTMGQTSIISLWQYNIFLLRDFQFFNRERSPSPRCVIGCCNNEDCAVCTACLGMSRRDGRKLLFLQLLLLLLLSKFKPWEK